MDMDEVSKAIGQTNVPDTPVFLTNCFISLAAPSLDGRTQLAFTMDQVRPLYFPLNTAVPDADLDKLQPIYLNYKALACVLVNCAQEDFKAGHRLLGSAAEILCEHCNTKFWTLGFLKKLVEESTKQPVDQPWMQFHAQRPSFWFEPASIMDIRNESAKRTGVEDEGAGFFKNHVLMLDEFIVTDENVFIRDLARAAGMICIVFHTNTRIASEEEVDCGASSSGYMSAWSLVVSKLDGACYRVLNEEFHLDSALDAIKAGRKANDAVCRFIDDFKEKQVQHLRPGLAVVFASALVEFSKLVGTEQFLVKRFKLGTMLDYLCCKLKDALIGLKPSIRDKFTGMHGKLGLFLPESYCGIEYDQTVEQIGSTAQLTVAKPAFFDAMKETFCNLEALGNVFMMTELVDEHFYYLKSPVNEWITLTVPSGPPYRSLISRSLQAKLAKLSNPRETCLQIYQNREWVDWDYVGTQFNQDEFLVNAACLFVPLEHSVSSLLFHATDVKPERIDGNTITIEDTELNSNSFDCTAAMSVVDASHYSRRPVSATSYGLDFTFKGQSGESFVSNIVYNLTQSPITAAEDKLFQVAFPEELSMFLQSCIMPYLYSLNRPDRVFDQFSNFNDAFYVQCYTQTGDFEQMSGKFWFKRGRWEYLLACECRFRTLRIDTNMALWSMDQAFWELKAKVLFIFCLECTDIVEGNKALMEYCEWNRVNMYRVCMIESNRFEIVPFTPVHKKPEHICIVFETNYINSLTDD